MPSRALPTWLLCLALIGCGSSDETATAPPSSTEGVTQEAASGAMASEPGPPAATMGPDEAAPATTRPTALDTATACERARGCCPAFVDAIGDPVEAERARIACEQMEHLSELGDASGEACLAAVDGWRRALELAERDVPASCR